MSDRQLRDDAPPEELSLHVGGEERLFDRTERADRPTELVVAPVELHRRNIQRRLREAAAPKDAFELTDQGGLSRAVLVAAGTDSGTLDRIDRLELLRSLSTEIPALPPAVRSDDPQYVEQLRTEVEAITNFHPERVAAWRGATGELDAPVDSDADELLEAALTVERALRERTEGAVSETALIRRATRVIIASDGTAWTAAYPDIERLTLLGVSGLSATDADLLGALLASTPVDVHLHAREGTGESVTSRVPKLLAVNEPGKVVFE